MKSFSGRSRFSNAFCEALFHDKSDADGASVPFRYINETTAYRGYVTLCKMLNTGHGVMADQRFRSDLKDWIDANAPHIARKEAWQGAYAKKHVRLWYNTRVDGLRLTEYNDACYLVGEPGREAWVGPDI